jgi:hypothetical protein
MGGADGCIVVGEPELSSAAREMWIAIVDAGSVVGAKIKALVERTRQKLKEKGL